MEASALNWVNFPRFLQIEIHVIFQRVCENIIRAYKHKRILIFSDSQAALSGD
jgi:hypothetical protein